MVWGVDVDDSALYCVCDTRIVRFDTDKVGAGFMNRTYRSFTSTFTAQFLNNSLVEYLMK